MVTFILPVAHHHQFFCAMQTTLKDIIIVIIIHIIHTKFGNTSKLRCNNIVVAIHIQLLTI